MAAKAGIQEIQAPMSLSQPLAVAAPERVPSAGVSETDGLSVSIVTWRIETALFLQVLRSLNQAVEALVRSTTIPGAGSQAVSVKIIDNGNQESLLREIIAGLQRDFIRYEVSGGIPNIGYGRAHNLAVLTTTAAWHLILNPDVILDENSLVTGIRYLRERRDISAVAPFAVDGAGNTQYLCKRFPCVLDLALRGFAPSFVRRLFHRRLARYELRDLIKMAAPVDQGTESPLAGVSPACDQGTESPLARANPARGQGTESPHERASAAHDAGIEVPIISGCFMLCDARQLKRTGGFDEQYFLYFEDFALSMELKKHGALAYLPAMKIQHFGGHSARKGLRHLWWFTASGIRFFNTYGWKWI